MQKLDEKVLWGKFFFGLAHAKASKWDQGSIIRDAIGLEARKTRVTTIIESKSFFSAPPFFFALQLCFYAATTIE